MKIQNRNRWLSGEIEPEIIETLDAIPWIATAKEFHERACWMLIQKGYQVSVEVHVPNRGDGYCGYMDIVARKGRTVAAIELDCRRPRKKSIFKVEHYEPATMKLVYCRFSPPKPRKHKPTE